MQSFGSVQSKSVTLIVQNDKGYYYLDFKGKYIPKTWLKRQQTETAEFQMQIFGSVQIKGEYLIVQNNKWIWWSFQSRILSGGP